MDTPPRYRQLAGHYLQAIQAGSLQPGDRLPSLRELMKLHAVSLSTALQVCRTLESEGWAQARDRSGYFVCRPQRLRAPPMDEPAIDRAPDPAQYIGIHEKVSDFVTQRRHGEVRLDLSMARGAPSLYPFDALRTQMTRLLRQRPQMLTTAAPSRSRRFLSLSAVSGSVPEPMRMRPTNIM